MSCGLCCEVWVDCIFVFRLILGIEVLLKCPDLMPKTQRTLEEPVGLCWLASSHIFSTFVVSWFIQDVTRGSSAQDFDADPECMTARVQKALVGGDGVCAVPVGRRADLMRALPMSPVVRAAQRGLGQLLHWLFRRKLLIA